MLLFTLKATTQHFQLNGFPISEQSLNPFSHSLGYICWIALVFVHGSRIPLCGLYGAMDGSNPNRHVLLKCKFRAQSELRSTSKWHWIWIRMSGGAFATTPLGHLADHIWIHNYEWLTGITSTTITSFISRPWGTEIHTNPGLGEFGIGIPFAVQGRGASNLNVLRLIPYAWNDVMMIPVPFWHPLTDRKHHHISCRNCIQGFATHPNAALVHLIFHVQKYHFDAVSLCQYSNFGEKGERIPFNLFYWSNEIENGLN